MIGHVERKKSGKILDFSFTKLKGKHFGQRINK
jgi:hypothetical protein